MQIFYRTTLQPGLIRWFSHHLLLPLQLSRAKNHNRRLDLCSLQHRSPTLPFLEELLERALLVLFHKTKSGHGISLIDLNAKAPFPKAQKAGRPLNHCLLCPDLRTTIVVQAVQETLMLLLGVPG
jgi:hypothetical protein